MTWAVIATGPSLKPEDLEAVRGLKVIAVSDAYKLAPWADVLCSTDRAWWIANPTASDFKGERYCGVTFDVPEGVRKFDGALSGSNSGLLGLKIAVAKGAKRILMLGFDMRGAHYFGAHKLPLKNTSAMRFDVFKRQFAQYQPPGVEIINCTRSTQLFAYPRAHLEDIILHGTEISSYSRAAENASVIQP